MDYLRGNLVPVPQDHAQVTYAKKLLKTESHLDWNRPALSIQNKIRAFHMGPGTWAEVNGNKFKIHRTQICEGPALSGNLNGLFAQKPGKILIEDEKLFAATASGILEILEIQQESRQKLKTIEFLKGNAISNGDFFK